LELKSDGNKSISTSKRHRREASQQLTPGQVKRERQGSVQVVSKAMQGLRCVYGPQAQPKSEGQAAALELVYNPPRTSIIVLPTSSGKSVLFFSVAAMAREQTVIVVVPFAALVDDVVVRAQIARLHCEEWVDERSGHELQQLVVVSADRAVSGAFLHYAKGLELNRQLAHVFFDECYVAFTDTLYWERLRELWKIRHLDCPFTGLTATLMVELE
jgi:superfamily II DNA helicase RecQ